MTDRFYVYVLLDPRKEGRFNYSYCTFFQQPFYVGKGSGNRVSKHFSSYRNRPIYDKARKIRVVTGSNPPVVFLQTHLNEEAAFHLEKEIISLIGRSDLGLGPLTNLTNGGEGTAGTVRSLEYRQRVSISLRGQQQSEETKRKRAQSLTGRVVTQSTREKIRIAQIGKPRRRGWRHTEETKAKMRRPKSLAAIENMKRARSKRAPMTAETRAKISTTLKGRSLPEATKVKMRGRIPWNKGMRRV